MESPSTCFDRFCIVEGLAQSPVPEDVLRLLDEQLALDRYVAREIASKHRTPQNCNGIYVGVVNSREFNAFAAFDKKSNWFYIGVNASVYYSSLKIFCRMMSDFRVLPNIGEPELERRDLPVADLMNLDQVLDGDSGISPQCPQRRIYAYMLYQDFMQFLITHELAHIMRGHVGWLNQNFGASLYSELRALTSLAVSSGESQAMEVNADISAAQLYYLIALDMHQTSTPEKYGEVRHKFFTDPWLDLMRHTLAVYVLFKLFMPHSFEAADLEAGSHPHSLVRQAFLMGSLNSVLTEQDSSLLRDMGAIGNTAVRVAENALSLVAGGDERAVVPDEYAKNYDAIADPMRKLLATVDQFRPKWQKFAWPSVQEGQRLS